MPSVKDHGKEAQARTAWLPYGRHSIDDDDVAAVVATLKSDWITQGAKIAEFEDAVAKICGAGHGVAFSSGTAALHAACVAAGVGPGDEVITTPLTFAATATAAIYCGAIPRFADIRPDTLNIDPVSIETQITDRTRVILPVDFAGHPADLDRIRVLARKYHLRVVEDAAHALGARFQDQPVGAISDMTVFSFHPVKHITTGEGGMVLTSDGTLADRLRRFRHHGIVQPNEGRPWRYEIVQLGHNYRITDIQCALGVSQLRKLSKRIGRRRELADRYRQALANVEEISLPSTSDTVEHAWHIFVVLLNLEMLTVDRDAILQGLRSKNIGATLHYPLVHFHPFFRTQFGYGEGLCPIAERVAPRLMTLPLFSAMADADVDNVIGVLQRVLLDGRRLAR